jgi:hypothetical protein
MSINVGISILSYPYCTTMAAGAFYKAVITLPISSILLRWFTFIAIISKIIVEKGEIPIQ